MLQTSSSSIVTSPISYTSNTKRWYSHPLNYYVYYLFRRCLSNLYALFQMDVDLSDNASGRIAWYLLIKFYWQPAIKMFYIFFLLHCRLSCPLLWLYIYNVLHDTHYGFIIKLRKSTMHFNFSIEMISREVCTNLLLVCTVYMPFTKILNVEKLQNFSWFTTLMPLY